MKALLEPVPFSRSRGHAPRLSPVYVPGRRNERFWSEAEIAVLREHYASKGAAFCATLLPGRTVARVYAKANSLGLKAREWRRQPRARRVTLTPELERTIRERWPSLAGKGAVSAFADELGLKRHTLTVLATKLGLTLPHRKEPPWSASELELLRRVPLHQPDRCSEIFREHGFRRSPTSIVVMAKRQNISRRYRETLSATAAAKVLGVDSTTISDYCTRGLLKAERRGTRRLPQQGGDAWAIRREDFRQWIIDNIGSIDIRKVDRFLFVDILTQTAPAAQP